MLLIFLGNMKGTLAVKQNFRKRFSFFLVLSCFSCLFFLQSRVNVTGQEGFFSITFLAPATCCCRNPWVAAIAEQLPEIGINVEVKETGWAGISPRTWSYPGPYPIPSYAEGGYDVLFVGWSWGLDWDPSDLFSSKAITPYGDNFYQYNRYFY